MAIFSYKLEWMGFNEQFQDLQLAVHKLYKDKIKLWAERNMSQKQDTFETFLKTLSKLLISKHVEKLFAMCESYHSQTMLISSGV